MPPEQLKETSGPGIQLPPNFCRDGAVSIPELRIYVAACIEFLASPMISSILECHPNDVAIQGPNPKWDSWWNWAACSKSKWTLLIPGWHQNGPFHAIPESLQQLLKTVDSLTLPRQSDFSTQGDEPILRGMSPKKSHEVFRMSSFIQQILQESPTQVRHVVDVGAGQGYLSRALSSRPFSKHVLALDFSEVQTKGAERRTSNNANKKSRQTNLEDVLATQEDAVPQSGSVTHETAHITSQTLKSVSSNWISKSCQKTEFPVPILFIALHACGSLTPDILRCFVESNSTNQDTNSHIWRAAGLVVAGCCYNLMSPESDFPLSGLVMQEQETQNLRLRLSYNHRSLAAQSPLQWTNNAVSKASAELAIRKVTYRALFSKVMFSQREDTSRGTFDDRFVKVGRLPDGAYSNFKNFMLEAGHKTAYQLPTLDYTKIEESCSSLMSSLETLHALRSRIGPVIESLIIADRYLYLVENLPNRRIVARNLFQQELGSGRNVVIAVWP